MARVICLGIVVLDHVHEVEAVPAAPTKVTATGYRETGGGIAATAAVAIAALGGEAAYWGRVGDDAAGSTLQAQLRRLGVDVTGLRRIAGAATPVAAAIVDREGERLLVVFPGRALDPDPSWLPLDEVAGAGAVMVDMRWREGAEALVAAARRHGVPSVLDAEIGEPAALAALVPAVDHAVFSERGLAQYAGTVSNEDGLRRAHAHGARHVAVTLGAAGSLWLGEDGALRRVPALPVAARDTTGAGDVFHGAFALALAEGRDVAAAARFASAAAALKCRNGRGWDGMASRAEVDRLLKEG
jgi:sulfofructose kinase